MPGDENRSLRVVRNLRSALSLSHCSPLFLYIAVHSILQCALQLFFILPHVFAVQAFLYFGRSLLLPRASRGSSFSLYFRMSPPLRASRHAPPIRTPAPLSAAPCSLGGVSEGLSSSPVQAAVLLILPHVSAASRLSTCSPNSHSRAAQRRSLLIGGRVGRSLLLSRTSHGSSFSLYFRMSPPLRASRHAPPIRTPAPLSAAPCSLGGVSEGLSSSPVQAAVLLILPHVSAASRLSTCSPTSHSRAAQRRSLLIGGRIGRALLLSRASTSRRRDFPILEV